MTCCDTLSDRTARWIRKTRTRFFIPFHLLKSPSFVLARSLMIACSNTVANAGRDQLYGNGLSCPLCGLAALRPTAVRCGGESTYDAIRFPIHRLRAIVVPASHIAFLDLYRMRYKPLKTSSVVMCLNQSFDYFFNGLDYSLALHAMRVQIPLVWLLPKQKRIGGIAA